MRERYLGAKTPKRQAEGARRQGGCYAPSVRNFGVRGAGGKISFEAIGR